MRSDAAEPHFTDHGFGFSSVTDPQRLLDYPRDKHDCDDYGGDTDDSSHGLLLVRTVKK